MLRIFLILLVVLFSKGAYAQTNIETKGNSNAKECEAAHKIGKSSEIGNPTREELKLAGIMVDVWFFMYYWGSKDINDADCNLGKIDNLNNYQTFNLYFGSNNGYKFKNISGLEHSVVKIFTMDVDGDNAAPKTYLVKFKDQKASLFKIYDGPPSEEQAINDIRNLLKNRLNPLLVIWFEGDKIIHQFQ